MKKTIGLFVLLFAIALGVNVTSATSAVPKTEMAFSIQKDVQVATITSNDNVILITAPASHLNAEVYLSTITYHLENNLIEDQVKSSVPFVESVSIEEHRKPPQNTKITLLDLLIPPR